MDHERVDRALYDGLDRAELLALLGEMTPDELHEYALNHDWESGLDPLFRVVERDDCDLGTALAVFWLAEPSPVFTGETPPPHGETDLERLRLLHYLRDRILRGGYARQRIRVDPLGAIDPDHARRDALERQGVPPVFLHPTPGEEPGLS